MRPRHPAVADLVNDGGHVARRERGETQERPAVVSVPTGGDGDIVEEDAVQPAGSSVITTSGAGADQPVLVLFGGRRTAVTRHVELLARPEGDAELVLRNPTVVGGDLGIQQVNGARHGEIHALSVIQVPIGRVQGNPSHVNEDLEVPPRVVRGVGGRVEVVSVRILCRSRTPGEAHVAVAKVASVPEVADQGEGIRTPKIGQSRRHPGRVRVLFLDARIRLGVPPPGLGRQIVVERVPIVHRWGRGLR